MAASPDLADRRCEPCRRGVPPVTGDELHALLAGVPDWAVHEGVRIERQIRTHAFADALALIDRIGALAEGEDHHPDLAFGWGYVRISLQTKAIGGLHTNDFILAAKIDRILSLFEAER